MGIIQKQGIKSSIFIMIGFVIGAVNLLVLFPMFFSKNDQGLVRAMIDIGATLSVFCTLGTLPVVYKFFPFYNHYLGPKKNELPFLTLIINLIGFALLIWIGWENKNFIIRKLGKSPSLASYFNYVYPYTFFLMIFYWLEAFAWGLQKGVFTNFLRETAVRILTTILILGVGLNWLNLDQFILLFSGIYVIPTLLLIYNLSTSHEWSFRSFKISSVTKRLKWKMLNFALFVFAGQFFNLLARTNDTFMIVGLRGLSDAGIFAIATYVAAIMEIPQRSLNAISIPVLAKSWKDKDFANIKHVYHKSVSNLLAIGLLLFGLIWLNIENLVAFLNWISHKEGGGYEALAPIVFIMGLAKLIDLATGVNGQIIGTSNYWRFDFFTNLFYIVLSIPLNFYLISNYSLIGLAYSNLAALTLYNSVRFLFLYKKFKLQPYTLQHGLFLIISIALMFIIYIIPSTSNFVINIAIKSSLYLLGFYTLIIWVNPAPELKELVQGFLKNKLLGFLRR
ncbi:MAG: lipopolysaccharide biosynthesis protein [Chitinophagia bacterium]|jgi:O-antigen/teichoic acid export membrane protein